MTRLLLLVMLLLAVGLVKLAEWNDQKVSFQLLPHKILVLPQITLLVLAFALGAGLVFVIHGLSDLASWVENLREGREEKRSEKAMALWKRAWAEINRSHLPQAVSVLERLVTLFPDHKEALLLYGDLKRSAGDYVGAIRIHRRARVFDEEDVRLVLALANDYEVAGRVEDSMALLREYFKKEGRNREVLECFRRLLVKNDRWEEALSVQTVLARSFEKGERRDREVSVLVGIRFEVGSLLHRQGQTEGARRAFRGALKIDPSFTPARIGLAEAQISEGREKEGIENLWEGWERTGQTLHLVRLEEFYLEKGNPDAVLTLYEKALGKKPGNPGLRFHQARIQNLLGIEEEALSLLEAMEGDAPWGGEFYRLMGEIYERRRQIEAAIDAYKRILNLDPSSDQPYVCKACRTFYPGWSGRCPSCHQWNTVIRTDGLLFSEKTPNDAGLSLLFSAPTLRTAYQEYFSGPTAT
ncbi:MAG: tetratricopeptide repeat protein [Nitrospirae bacterium]|nr:tetratricopeptide repeat protein [Nitrospirota bacterium]